MAKPTVKHILARFVIHVFSSTGFLILAIWLFWGLERFSWWEPLSGWWQLVLPATLCFMLAASREIWDVSRGGWIGKSVIDWISWAVGLGLSCYGLYRLTPRLTEILLQVEGLT